MSHQIYALLDVALNDQKGVTFEEFIRLALDKQATILQYRDKTNNLKTKIDNIQKLRSIWPNRLIANDSIELVQYCDGIHVGQEDLLAIDNDKKEAIQKIREQIGQKIIGISTHNIEEVVASNSLEIDYIGLGAYRNTTTKEINYLLGDSLSYIASFAKHPVAAIGGVKASDMIPHVTYLVLGSAMYEN